MIYALEIDCLKIYVWRIYIEDSLDTFGGFMSYVMKPTPYFLWNSVYLVFNLSVNNYSLHKTHVVMYQNQAGGSP